MNFSPALNIAARTARSAGQLAMGFFKYPEKLEVQQKGPHDPVSNADTAVEREIIHKLRKAYPDYGILGEETGGPPTPTEWRWIIDPIDGTTNFIRGIPHFAVSIALARGNDILAGVVYNPVLDELFAAEKGRGAFLNTFRLRVGDRKVLKESLLATGFPFRHRLRMEAYLSTFRAFCFECGEIRRAGSASLDLVYTAAGRFDGYWEMNLKPWDIAAGGLILQEAGGYLTDFEGGKNFLESGDVVGANPTLHRQMLPLIKQSADKTSSRNQQIPPHS